MQVPLIPLKVPIWYGLYTLLVVKSEHLPWKKGQAIFVIYLYYMISTAFAIEICHVAVCLEIVALKKTWLVVPLSVLSWQTFNRTLNQTTIWINRVLALANSVRAVRYRLRLLHFLTINYNNVTISRWYTSLFIQNETAPYIKRMSYFSVLLKTEEFAKYSLQNNHLIRFFPHCMLWYYSRIFIYQELIDSPVALKRKISLQVRQICEILLFFCSE